MTAQKADRGLRPGGPGVFRGGVRAFSSCVKCGFSVAFRARIAAKRASELRALLASPEIADMYQTFVAAEAEYAELEQLWKKTLVFSREHPT